MRISQMYYHVLHCHELNNRTRDSRSSRSAARILPHHKLILVTGGKGWVTIEKKRYPLRSGMLLYIAPNSPHIAELDADDPGSFLTVHFRCARVMLADDHWTVEDDAGKLSLPLVQEVKEYHPLAELFRRMVDGWMSRPPGYEFLARTMLQQVLIGIYQNGNKQVQSHSAMLKVEQAIAYMTQKRSARITVYEVAALVQLSPTYFSRIFKENTGFTMIEFFNRMKIDQAKEMLLEGDKKIKEVAQELGFKDEFYFSRLFRQLAGVSPSEFYGRKVHEV